MAYAIPDLEDWSANNLTGTEDKPFLHKITRTLKWKKSGLVFHIKVREFFYEMVKHTFYKDPCVWYIRCQQFKHGCKFRAKIKFAK